MKALAVCVAQRDLQPSGSNERTQRTPVSTRYWRVSSSDWGTRTEQRGLTESTSRPADIFALALLSQDAARPSMHTWHLPAQQQPVATSLMLQLKEKQHTTTAKSKNFANKVLSTHLWCGQPTVGPTQPSPEQCNMLLTFRLAVMCNRCQRQPLNAGGNMNFRLHCSVVVMEGALRTQLHRRWCLDASLPWWQSRHVRQESGKYERRLWRVPGWHSCHHVWSI